MPGTLAPGTFVDLRALTGGELIVVREGLVKRYDLCDDSRQIIFSFDFRGALFPGGEPNGPQILEAIEATRLCAFDAALVNQLACNSMRAFNWIHASLHYNALMLSEKIALMSARTASERLHCFLVALARWRGLAPPVDGMALPMSRDDIGCYLNMSAETVSRSFSALHEMHRIRLRGPRCIDVLKSAERAARIL